MWLWDYVTGLLKSLGIMNKSGVILMLGIDDAGKTTLLQYLKTGNVHTHNPTLHANLEEFSIGGLNIQAYDLGGHEQARRVWRDYLVTADAIVFIIDAADKQRVGEAYECLHSVLSAAEHLPVAVLGNKVDKPGAFGPDEFVHTFALSGLTTGKNNPPPLARLPRRPLEVFMCSIKKRVGFQEAFQWMANYIN